MADRYSRAGVLSECPACQGLHRRSLGVPWPADEVVSLRGRELHTKHAHQRTGSHPRLAQAHRYECDAETALGGTHRSGHGVELEQLSRLGPLEAYFLGPTAPGEGTVPIDDQWQGAEHLAAEPRDSSGMLGSAYRGQRTREQPRT